MEMAQVASPPCGTAAALFEAADDAQRDSGGSGGGSSISLAQWEVEFLRHVTPSAPAGIVTEGFQGWDCLAIFFRASGVDDSAGRKVRLTSPPKKPMKYVCVR
jgi:hypothetical protein